MAMSGPRLLLGVGLVALAALTYIFAGDLIPAPEGMQVPTADVLTDEGDIKARILSGTASDDKQQPKTAQRQSIPLPDGEAVPSFVGFVKVRGSGEPVAGVRVFAYVDPMSAYLKPETGLVTDKDGRFELRISSSAKLCWLKVYSGEASTFAERDIQKWLVPGRTDSQEFYINPPATLRGHVVDQEGKGVSGAQVHGWNGAGSGYIVGSDKHKADRIVTTDQEGSLSCRAWATGFP